MRHLVFAANWKMNIGPLRAREYLRTFLASGDLPAGREVWFFPPAVSLEACAHALSDYSHMLVGAQDVYWELKGAFTGALSAPLAGEAGARAALIGHSERRHVFGETDAETGKKVGAVVATGMLPVLCVGETLAQREAGQTLEVVMRQLEAAFPRAMEWERAVVAYEPVWAIGTGRNATPKDAAEVHAAIRRWLTDRGAESTNILYGGSVNLKNVAELLAEPELDGVLVGGASLDPQAWAELVRTAVA